MHVGPVNKADVTVLVEATDMSNNLLNLSCATSKVATHHHMNSALSV